MAPSYSWKDIMANLKQNAAKTDHAGKGAVGMSMAGWDVTEGWDSLQG
jgi:hypothetical protein